MSLIEREQRVLDAIRDGLAASDPSLVGQLGTFNRLTSAEDMPGREKIQAGSRPAYLGEARGYVRRAYRRLGLPWIAMLAWLLIAISLIAVGLLLRHGGS